MSRLLIAAAACLGASPLFAQVAGEAPVTVNNNDTVKQSSTVSPQANEEIVPASARTVMGGSSNSIPWSWSPTHFMSVYLGSELPTKAYPIRCIAFRANNRVDTGATIDLEMWLGYTTNDQTTLNTTYASNYNVTGQNKVLVYRRKMTRLADMERNTDPLFFQYQLNLDVPFVYTPVAGRNLVFECKVHGNSNNNSSFSFFCDNESGTGTTTSRLFTSNDANATTGILGRNYGPVLRFDLKCKVNADAVDYGMGTTNKPVLGPDLMPIPDYARTYAFTNNTRGMWFQAPVDFTIRGLRVPDENNHGKQNVAVYVMPTQTVDQTPKFQSMGRPSAAIVPTNISVKKDEFVCILGSCGDANSTQNNSYNNGLAATGNILGQAVTFKRAWVNDDIVTKQGVVAWNFSTSNLIGRTEVYITGQARFNPPVVPMQTTGARPVIGKTARLDTMAMFSGSQAGILLLGATRLNGVPSPFGNIYVSLPSVLTIPVPAAGANVPLPVPNSQTLVGSKVRWQTFYFDITSQVFGSTNGTEWTFGEQ